MILENKCMNNGQIGGPNPTIPAAVVPIPIIAK
jgi:hypothetical protein